MGCALHDKISITESHCRSVLKYLWLKSVHCRAKSSLIVLFPFSVLSFVLLFLGSSITSPAFQFPVSRRLVAVGMLFPLSLLSTSSVVVFVSKGLNGGKGSLLCLRRFTLTFAFNPYLSIRCTGSHFQMASTLIKTVTCHNDLIVSFLGNKNVVHVQYQVKFRCKK